MTKKITIMLSEQSAEVIKPIFLLGLESAKNTEYMNKIRDSKETLEELISQGLATSQIYFFYSIHGKEFKCPKCGNRVEFHCPRGICGYCNLTVNLTSEHSQKLCNECAGMRKGECKHPGNADVIHFKI